MKSLAYLRELDRRELVNQAPARFLPMRRRAARIKKLIGNLEIIAASDEPIGLDQAFDLNKGNRSGKPELKA
jgi:hypothetical protein